MTSHRRTLTLVLDDDQASTFDAVKFLDGPEAVRVVLADWLEAAGRDREVVALKRLRRRQHLRTVVS